MFKLREYQQKSVDAAVKHLTGRSKKNGIVVVPTGGGKSLVISSIAKELHLPTLVLQPSKEILLQNYDKAISFGMEPTIYSASCKKKELSTLTYATLRSIKKDIAQLRKLGIKVVLVDEAHAQYSAEEGSEFMTFIKQMGDIKVLGFTATPCKLRSYSVFEGANYSKLNFLTKDQPRFFDKIVHVTQVQELTSQGFWTPIKYEIWDFDESGLMLNSTGAEYTEDSIRSSIEKSGLNNTIYRRLLMLMKERKHILVCMDSVESCNRISSFMNNKFGRITDYVTGTTSLKKRENIIKEFKEGKLKIVFNYSALATGFDFPELDCVVFGRPTFSFVVYSQFVGRGVRIHKDKTDCLFVDCCNNYKRFGAIEDIVIEDFPGRGYCMFSGNKLITGIRMGDDVYKEDLIRRYNQGKAMEEMIGADRRKTIYDDYEMYFGKYIGEKFSNIPVSYIHYLVDKGIAPEEMVKYYDEIKV